MLYLVLAGKMPAFGQDSTIVYSANIQVSLASRQTPYWLQSNQYGAFPESGSFISGQWGIYKIYKPENKKLFQWSGGIQFISNISKSSTAFFTDLYTAAKLGPIELSIGQRKSFYGLADTTLTSGSLAMSDNSRPYPKIQISSPGFINLIPKHDLVAFKFSYSDGLLGSALVHYGNVDHVPDIYMHQKSIYLRFGGKGQKINLYAGFNHQVIWGGEDKIFTGGLKSWEAYKYVIFGKAWAASRVGNHFGTIDLGGVIKGKNWDIFLYRQAIYEDGSLRKLSNIADGLNGLSFKRNKTNLNHSRYFVKRFLFEYVYTKSQGGSVFDYNAHIFGNDNYYNHYVYTQGWSYRNRSIGTPLIGPQNVTDNTIPRHESIFTNNNRIMALHAGFEASISNLDILVKSTYSNNSGTYDFPFTPSLNQYLLLLRIEKPIRIWNKSHLSISLATDLGKLYPKTSALTFGWHKVGFF